MPTYQYACTACDHRFEAVQAFSDDALTACPECGGKLRKVFSSVGIVFKGSGFYRTDSRSGSVNGSGSESGGAESGKSESGTSESGKSEVKADSGSSSSSSGSSGSSDSSSKASSGSSGSSSSSSTASSAAAASS